MIGIYPGSFDPLTLGHYDIIERANNIVDELYIVVLRNINKESFFTVEERIDMLQETLKNFSKIKIESSSKLMADYFKLKQADYVIRGLRAVSDFEYELQMALTNRSLEPKLETIFLMPSQQYIFLSSSVVKDIVKHHGDVSKFVPTYVNKKLIEKMQSIDT